MKTQHQYKLNIKNEKNQSITLGITSLVAFKLL